MRRFGALVIAMAMLVVPSVASDRSAAVAKFKEYLQVCTENPDERGLAGCVADQVGAETSYLGDIISETEQRLTGPESRLLDRSQTAFEAYLKASCTYQAKVNAPLDDKLAAQFCVLRLTDDRIADILEGNDFLRRD